MIDSQRGAQREWNNCFIKNNREIFLDFALQEQPEDNLMVAIPNAWYNGSYTMAAKPIKSQELHYTMTRFLIIGFINRVDKVISNLFMVAKFPFSSVY